ncbi:MAG: elements of external origin [Methylocystis sp.]|nr:elements of external origin [Methylocystis sp.]MCA3587008.1 elements of external origin [Methylocystis sp.]MCA3591299.1 elements of external origin [Methylocystis sp.]
MGLSRRAYARHRGVSDMAVRKAIASGRITVEDDGTIDPERADRAWGSSSDPAQVRPIAKSPPPPRGTPRPVPLAAVEAVRETLRESGEPAPAAGNMTFVQARTANEVIKAQERRIRLGKLKGDLVDRSRAVSTVFALARRERDAWVQWPARAAALIAAELQIDPHRCEQVLEAHVRRHLAELSEIGPELQHTLR